MIKLHFLPQEFRFEYEDGGSLTFSGSVAVCVDKYRNSKRKIKAVYQLKSDKFVKISD